METITQTKAENSEPRGYRLIQVQLPEELARRGKAIAAAKGITWGQLLNEAVEQYVEAREGRAA